MAMNSELAAIVSYIERERGVEREDVLTAIEGAIKQAASHNPGVTNDLRVVINRKDLSLHVYDTMVVSNEETGTGFRRRARASSPLRGRAASSRTPWRARRSRSRCRPRVLDASRRRPRVR